MKYAPLFAVVAACSFPRASDNFECAVDSDCAAFPGRTCESGFCVTDGEPDNDAAPPDMFDLDCMTWPAPAHFMPCMIDEPTESLTIDGAFTYDTTTGTLSGPGSPPNPLNKVVDGSMLISVVSFTVTSGGTLRVIGDKPLIVASWTTIDIDGAIDVGSNATDLGAGANTGNCAAHLPARGGNSGGGGGGSGGGGFGAAGGRGGNGDGVNGGNGGAAIAMRPLLLGGCAGAIGGNADNGEDGGLPGAGGGAIQLTAQMSITIAGQLNAGGQGGLGGKSNNNNEDDGGGGGGGGSGGMIGLEAPSITIDAGAKLGANGGGGGQGGGNTMTGTVGADGTATDIQATGGNMGDSAGDGGLGSGGATLVGGLGTNGNANGSANGGGGGGGGAGFIVFSSATAATVAPGVVISPAQTVVAP